VQHAGEHALAGHDALAHFLIDRASGVALLADLRELQHHVVALKLRADGKSAKIEALHDKVFPKRAVDDLSAARTERLDLFMAQQGNLSVPLSGVGIVFDAPVLDEAGGTDVLFLGTLAFADTNS
jgi:hypothetical protein